ncbi:hypothetical protein N473_10740 [Pseudoalteromonas luteoviolacea CPMOR-1]|uniref:Uncharacterized protein n=1 Tax=Pseudoalteromonas luteoviolacea CPMOR-1 TaxID=1365248 RepID=A0A167MAH5_9GAMM|nr:hypothetical protein N473_10740 [Pseudoalteromonas luteoviolacea CPMOR-1]
MSYFNLLYRLNLAYFYNMLCVKYSSLSLMKRAGQVRKLSKAPTMSALAQ